MLYNIVSNAARLKNNEERSAIERSYGIEEGRAGVGEERANEGADGAAVEKAPKNSEAKPVTSSGFRRSRNCKKSASRARSSGCLLM